MRTITYMRPPFVSSTLASLPATFAEPPVCATPNQSTTTSMPPVVTFPQRLLDAHRDRKLAVLFGSGLSMGVPGNFPRWDQLPDRLLDLAEKQGIWNAAQIKARRAFFKAGHVSLEAMLADLDAIKTALGGAQGYLAALASIFQPADGAPGAAYQALAELDVQIVLTTNFDRLHEAADPSRITYTWLKSDKALASISRGQKILFKIHGTAEDDDSVVMTRAEYDKAAGNVQYQSAMKDLLKNYTFLVLGYGINDPLDLDLVFELNKTAFGSAAQRHYALMREDQAKPHRDRWDREMNIQVVEYADHNDLPSILRLLAKNPRNPP